MSLIEELKCRNVIRVAIGYVAGELDNNNIRALTAMISLIEGRQSDALDALDALPHGSGVEPQVVASLCQLTPLAMTPDSTRSLQHRKIILPGNKNYSWPASAAMTDGKTGNRSRRPVRTSAISI